MFKCLHNSGPENLKNLLCVNTRRQGLRSSNRDLELIVPRVEHKIFVARSFRLAGPKIWNSLPNDLRLQETVDRFKGKLKTYLFDKYYNSTTHWIYY